MRRCRSRAELRTVLAGAPRPLGFVPTMGSLHQGHAANVRRCREECATVVASVFVNPLQFGAGEDFQRYPRDPEGDAERLASWGTDVLFAPDASEMVPPGLDTRVVPGAVAEGFEGVARPGHFVGVATIVTKLFWLVGPDRAYFGEKDAQQLAVIEKTTRDLDVPVSIVRVPTVREPDGLALSSRNVYLDAQSRIEAAGLARGLFRARDAWERGERDPARLEALAREAGLSYDYCACVDAETFGPPAAGRRLRIVAAARVGGVRLIDNVTLPGTL